MAKRFKLRELEAAHGNLEALIVPMVNEVGQGGAAHRLNTTQATISTFLRKHGYVKVFHYEKKESQAS